MGVGVFGTVHARRVAGNVLEMGFVLFLLWWQTESAN